MSKVIPSFYLPGDSTYVNKGRIPYIGVTGFTAPNHIISAINTYAEELDRSGATHNFMIGILLSHKTLHGEGTPSKSARYPALDKIPELLDAVKRNRKYGTIAAIHYNTKDPHLFDELELIDDTIGDKPYFLFDAIQFNTDFIPDEQEIKKIKARYRDRAIIIIVQLNGTIMAGHDIAWIARQLSRVPVDDVLVDPSRGKGKDINIITSSNVYKVLRDNISAGIGFAGGFGPDNIEEKTRQYVHELGTKRFSVDAEGKLRDPITDLMSIDRVNGYIRGFFRGIANRE